MDELISNLEHCLSIFEAPTVASTEHNLYFIRSSISQFVIPYLNRKGISNGMDIVIRLVVKPTSSINKAQDTVTQQGKKQKSGLKEDTTLVLRPELFLLQKPWWL